MKTASLRTLGSSIGAVALLLAGCASPNATAPAGSTASATDVGFVTNLYNVVDFDHEVIDQVLAKNPDPRVASLARDFMAQGNELEARVSPIAAREGILPPQGQRFVQRADLQSRIASVTGNSPINFDQEFLADEVYSHEQALKSARAMSQQTDGNPQLMAISQEATGVLQANLSSLNKLQAQIVADRN